MKRGDTITYSGMEWRVIAVRTVPGFEILTGAIGKGKGRKTVNVWRELPKPKP